MDIPMDDKHLAQLGENTARALRLSGTVGAMGTCRALRRSLSAVRDSQRRVSDRTAGRAKLPQAAEWLLDNWYLAQREGRDAAEAFRIRAKLPAVSRDGRQSYVMELGRSLAWAGEVTVERLAIFLAHAQAVRSLTELELSLFVSAVKGALVERLAEASHELERELDSADEDSLARLSRTMEAIFTALRTLGNANLGRLLEESSAVEQQLRRDPTGDYARMDDVTRARYRQEVCRLSKRLGRTEEAVAREAVERSQQGTGEERHVGYHLFRAPLSGGKSTATGVAYVAAVVLPTLFIVLLVGFLLHTPVVAPLLLLPVSDIVKNCVDFLVVRLFRPRPVLRMELKDGVPGEGKTLCVIATLITGEKSGGQLCALLERYRLSNRNAGENLSFGLLADLPDSDLPMGKAARGYVETAQKAVDALNEKYGGGFYLFFRQPAFQSRDERYMGWERKRGALLELVRLLKGRRTGIEILAGSKKALQGTRYVITLDSDTSLNVGAARELIGAMLHPLNRPRVDPKRRVVVSGYGLLQPRVGVELSAANKSQFSRIFAGQGGVDPYGSTTSDVYHDLFDQGSFTGKGIFDVDAFFTCLDGRFPPNTILSHDLLEGSYLHVGLIGDVELTDGYPYKVTSYFSRLHRWVRGDWQLLPWLGLHVRNEAGERVRNPIPAMAKWKIFDNLRRSLSPVCTLTALLLGMCVSGAAFGFAAAAAILSAASNLLLSGAELAFRRGAGLRSRYHSTIIAGFGGLILQTVVQLLFLPVHAWTCASAICTALWRSLFSHRGMLAWVTAADAERSAGDGIWANYRKQWSAVAVGLIAVLFSLFPAGAAAGLIWLASPVFSWAMSRPIQEKGAIPASDRAFLLHEGGLIWRYFADFLRPADHYLPPDNFQEQPAVGLARRTSPTNIGMALLCVLAAADLDFTTRDRSARLLGHMLDTLERLPKWKGHLYNWYDTASAKPLTPRYVSTVDGGNLCGCLIALREGLYEWGETDLARRAEALSNAMDFSDLYDPERKLFYIGYDVEKQAYTQGWYDLMASEARQTSFLAVARGEVDHRHWRRLGRMLVKEDDYSGMASWTGTMFEYLMPNLLLPCEKNSLMYESLAFCVHAQRRRGRSTGTPWGISESGFYAFDPGMSYQYKAHGVQRLGLKRGLDGETVISPYSSFLALLLTPISAAKNLRRLRDMGLEGKYGLYEAADFTPARLTGEEKWETVCSYMAHHLGMSLVAIDNALNENVMQRRFMRDCSMSAYRELLQEKVPVGAAVMRDPSREVPEKPRRVQGGGFLRSGTGCDQTHPACHLVSNGSYTVLCTDGGSTASTLDKLALTLPGHGVYFFLRETGGAVWPLTALPYGGKETEYGWRFKGNGAEWTAKENSFTAKTTLRVPDRESGELREVELCWSGERPLEGELCCYLEPVLARLEDYQAHPAFSKLSIQSSHLGDGVLFTRRARERGQEHPALAVFWDAAQAHIDTSREQALGRGGLRAIEQALARPAGESVGAVLDPCLLARFPLRLEPGESTRIRVAVAAGTEEDASRVAQRLLRLPKASGLGYLDKQIIGNRLTREEALQTFFLLEYLVGQDVGRIDKPTLWPFGISGDLPLIAAWAEPEEESGLALAKQYQLLSRCGYAFDLVFLLRDGGDYRRPARGALLDGLKALGLENRIGARGSIHLADCADESQARPILAAAALVLGPEEPVTERERDNGNYEKGNDFTLKTSLPEYGFDSDGNFVMEMGKHLPPLGWSQILANPAFGWLTDETGCGHLWKGNARECQLTPWNNDPLAIGGPEIFALQADGAERSIFAAADGLRCWVTYGPGFAHWEKAWGDRTLTTTAFVPLDRPERIMRFELSGKPCKLRHDDIFYELEGTLTLATGTEGTRILPDEPDLRAKTLGFWADKVKRLTVESPDEELNHYLNGWCLYQTLACRLFARTSRYQNGGAFGFRDQLQDVCAALYSAPELARQQILSACAHQFEEGDVLHWWHALPEGDKGVRTRISDDLLWLAYTLCEYLDKTGDASMLMENTPYLTAPVLGEEEYERYEQPTISQEMGTVYEHARRAVDCALGRGTGEHGLLLMGTGDWNDGMNRVGAEGRGESVWLTWFAAHVLERFAAVVEAQGEREHAEQYREKAAQLSAAANAAWDGEWFLRGYYDDGSTLGGHADEECRIDSIAQSWAALAPGGDREKAETAVRAALDRLLDKEHRLVKLFTPAFDAGERDPGYIRGYVPGVRENGGQYTHAAVWLALGCFRLGMAEEGWEVMRTLLPAGRDEAVYKTEPYVLAADVYSNPSHPGRGGWSWYTGAAGWYYRVAVEELLGLRLKAGRLFIEPNLPAHWPGYSAVWRAEKAVFRITVRRDEQKKTLLDGEAVQEGICLSQYEGEHKITATI